MTSEEFTYCYELACKGNGRTSNIHLFDGYGLPGFKPVECLPEDFAGLIVWQTFQFNGEVDTEALKELKRYRKRFELIVPTARIEHVKVKPDRSRRVRIK